MGHSIDTPVSGEGSSDYDEDDGERRKKGKDDPEGEKDIMTLLREAAELKSCQLNEKQRTFHGAPEFFKMTLKQEDCLTEARELPAEEKLAKSNEWKLEGNKYLTEGDFSKTRDLYVRALSVYTYFETQDEWRPLIDHSDEQPDHVALLFNNLCLLMQKKHNFKDAMYAINECLQRLSKTHASYPKALYRRAQCYIEEPNLDAALRDLHTVLELNPSNVEAKQLYGWVRNEMKKMKRKMGGLFAEKLYEDETEEQRGAAKRKQEEGDKAMMRHWGEEMMAKRLEGGTLSEHGIWIDRDGRPVI